MSSRFFAGFDRDVIRTNEHDLGRVPVFFHFENDVRLDDLRIIEMQALDLSRDVIVDRIGDLQVAAGDFDGGWALVVITRLPFAYI